MDRPIEDSAIDAVAGKVDAIIVTGLATGNAPPAIEAAQRVKKCLGIRPYCSEVGLLRKTVKVYSLWLMERS